MRKIALLLVLVLSFAVSCKKTVESEKKAWDSNMKIMSSLAAEYPNFAEIIKAETLRAEEVMKSADAIASDEEKIKKMAEANGILYGTYASNIYNIKSTRETLKKKIFDVKGLRLDYSEMNRANYASSEAESAIIKAESGLKSPMLNKSAADLITGDLLNSMKNAEKNLDVIISDSRAKLDAEQKKVEEAKVEAQKVEEKKIEEAKPLICKYCGTSNPPTATSCKSCGAALK